MKVSTKMLLGAGGVGAGCSALAAALYLTGVASAVAGAVCIGRQVNSLKEFSARMIDFRNLTNLDAGLTALATAAKICKGAAIPFGMIGLAGLGMGGGIAIGRHWD